MGNITTKLTDGSHNPPRNSMIGYPMLSSQNVNYGAIDFSKPSRYVSEEDFFKENQRTDVKSGDVLTIVASLGSFSSWYQIMRQSLFYREVSQ